jgi:hypothetical protein
MAVTFERPPDKLSEQRRYRVTEHNYETGMTMIEGFPRALSAQEMSELGASMAPVILPEELKPDWEPAGRMLDRAGAGDRPKIYQFSVRSPDGYYALKPADDQAALALAQRAADETGESWVLARTASGNLVVGSHDALQRAGEGLGAQFLLEVQPGILGDGDSVTLSQARELVGSDRAREAVADVLASMAGLPDSAIGAVADAVLQAIVGLLPAEKENPLPLPWPGWRIRPELLPEVARLAAGIERDSP